MASSVTKAPESANCRSNVCIAVDGDNVRTDLTRQAPDPSAEALGERLRIQGRKFPTEGVVRRNTMRYIQKLLK